MSDTKRRKRKPPSWPFVLLALAVMIVLACVLIRAAVGVVHLTGSVLSDTRGAEADPMFREDAEKTTIPPDLGMPEDDAVYGDNSGNWDTSVQTPVERSAAELAQDEREALSTGN